MYARLEKTFPDDGPYARSNYPKHMAHLNGGAKYHQRAFIGGNGSGKTTLLTYEATCHLTGIYPDWWEGKRYASPTDVLMAGRTKETTRDILQTKLLGDVAKRGEDALGTGMIPKDMIGKPVYKHPSSTRAVDFVPIRHVSGMWSILSYKSYEQKAEGFEGVERHFIGLDEEPDMEIFAECVMRTRTVDGIVALTYMPIAGYTELTTRFEASQEAPEGDMMMVRVGMDDVPHLTEDEKRKMLSGVPHHQINARRYGLPLQEGGGIFSKYMNFEDIAVDPFRIPNHWPRLTGGDVGFAGGTAFLWAAWDQDSDTRYLYAEYKQAEKKPEEHFIALNARGLWIPCEIDPNSRGRSQRDGTKLFEVYKSMGVKVIPAGNQVWAGISAISQRMCSGRWKAFSTLQEFAKEFRNYAARVKEDGTAEVIKKADHLMDAWRYIENAPPSHWKLKHTPDVKMMDYEPVTFGVT